MLGSVWESVGFNFQVTGLRTNGEAGGQEHPFPFQSWSRASWSFRPRERLTGARTPGVHVMWKTSVPPKLSHLQKHLNKSKHCVSAQREIKHESDTSNKANSRTSWQKGNYNTVIWSSVWSFISASLNKQQNQSLFPHICIGNQRHFAARGNVSICGQ